MTKKKTIYVIGGGPAGLAAAKELTKKESHRVCLLEKEDKVGGISRTESYKGYLFDIGGHRFFTKNQTIEILWKEILGSDFLRVTRRSRIFYNRRFFHYPLRFWDTIANLGVFQSGLVLASYLHAKLFPFSQEDSFAEWTTNRFGKRLYQLFFKSYTEKVWGIPCDQIQSDWATQRIKGLSFSSAATNAIFKNARVKSLIDEFSYPRLGPGMMWQKFGDHIGKHGGTIELNCTVVALHHRQGRISELTCRKGEETVKMTCDEVISTLPLANLIAALDPPPPASILRAAGKIAYRAFIIVVLILDQEDVFPDQWLYIHAPEVLVGRIQNFKNWSTAMVPDRNTTSLGLEYFCNEHDEVWDAMDTDLVKMATKELADLGIAGNAEVIDSIVIRQPKAYPVYDQGYKEHLVELKTYLQRFENLPTVGRNGMHRYNNMDHSMQTGIMAAENVLGSRHNIWDVKDEDDYLEERGVCPSPRVCITGFRRPIHIGISFFSAVILSFLFYYCW